MFRFCFIHSDNHFVIIINFLKQIQMYDLWPKIDIFKSTKSYIKLFTFKAY